MFKLFANEKLYDLILNKIYTCDLFSQSRQPLQCFHCDSLYTELFFQEHISSSRNLDK